MAYRAFVFIRPSSPQVGGVEFGHVGWGFQIDATRYIVGAVENPAGAPVSPPGKTGYWSEITTDPFLRPSLGQLGTLSAYDAYKEIPVDQPNIAAAKAKMQEISQQGYEVAGKNCMDATYAILREYGIYHLPNPSLVENYLPNCWFSHIAFPPKALMGVRAKLDVVLYEHPEYQGARLIINHYGPSYSIANLADYDFFRKASSLQVRSGNLTLFTGANNSGDSVKLSAGLAYPYLGGWARMGASLTMSTASRRAKSSTGELAPLSAPDVRVRQQAVRATETPRDRNQLVTD